MKAKGTHRPMGKTGGASGMKDGLTSVEKFKAGQGVDTFDTTQRPKKQDHGSASVG